MLLVTADPIRCRSLEGPLQQVAFEFLTAHDGPQALAVTRVQHPDVIVLDLDLPHHDSTHLVNRLQARTRAPVLVLSHTDAPTEKAHVLNAGAHDYLARPVAITELLARVQAKLRRRGRQVLRAGDVSLDLADRLAWFWNHELQLSTAEFNLLATLVQHSGQVLTRERLAGGLRTDKTCSLNAVTMHVSNLKRKLWQAGGHRTLRTIRNVGYRI